MVILIKDPDMSPIIIDMKGKPRPVIAAKIMPDMTKRRSIPVA